MDKIIDTKIGRYINGYYTFSWNGYLVESYLPDDLYIFKLFSINSKFNDGETLEEKAVKIRNKLLNNEFKNEDNFLRYKLWVGGDGNGSGHNILDMYTGKPIDPEITPKDKEYVNVEDTSWKHLIYLLNKEKKEKRIRQFIKDTLNKYNYKTKQLIEYKIKNEIRYYEFYSEKLKNLCFEEIYNNPLRCDWKIFDNIFDSELKNYIEIEKLVY